MRTQIIKRNFVITPAANKGVSVITGASFDPTKPTTMEIDRVIVERQGRYLVGDISLCWSSAAGAAAGTGTYLFTLPDSLQIDSTYQTIAAAATLSDVAVALCGEGHIAIDGSLSGDLKVFAYSATKLACYINSSSNGFWSSGFFSLNTANIGAKFTFRVPILGWD